MIRKSVNVSLFSLLTLFSIILILPSILNLENNSQSGNFSKIGQDIQSPISNNAPSIGIMLSTTEIYRNNTLYFNVTPSDAETSFGNLIWNSTIVRASTSTPLSDPSSELNRSYFFPLDFDNSYLGEYYIEANISDSDGESSTTRVYFTVLNNAPLISYPRILFSDSESTDPENNETLRYYGTIDIEVNVSDIDLFVNEELSLDIYAISKIDNTHKLDFTVEEGINSNFSCTASIPSESPIGEYSLYFKAYEAGNDNEPIEILKFFVINNAPNASMIECTINDLTPLVGGLSFQEFEQLNFNISITDCDLEGIELIKLCLINENKEWTNFTFQNYQSADEVVFSIRAKDLDAGQWYTYIYVLDTDGVWVVTTQVISFNIIPDTFSVALPWLMLLFGGIVGIAIGSLVIGIKYLSLKRDYESYMLEQGIYSAEERTKKAKKPSQKKKKTQRSLSETEETIDIDKTKIDDSGIDASSDKKKRKLIRKIK